MKASTHLISMPWSGWSYPSISISCLKSYLDRVFAGQLETRTYSGHVGVLLELGKAAGFDFYKDYVHFGEDFYYFATYRRYLSKSKRDPMTLTRMIAVLNQRHPVGSKVNFVVEKRITLKAVNELETATRSYIDKRIIPRLDPTACNVVGFSINFDQIYSSIYCAKYLQESRPGHRFLFLFGGWGGSSPMVADLLRKNGIQGLMVIGEGEKKLELLMKTVLATPEENEKDLPSLITSTVPGVCEIDSDVDLFKREEKFYQTQFQSIESLPVPNYDEYFETLKTGLGGAAYEQLKNWINLLAEGSRGCFAHCDFCGMNYQWKGFRKNNPEQIYENVRKLCDRYQTKWVQFTDNVCDTWAEKYADLLIESSTKVDAWMYLRAHHPETFWTKLSLAGVYRIQIGVEAIAPKLLKAIGKGTLVIQNLCAQKYLKELGVHSASNLITCHPRSSAEDVAETKRILEKTPHFGPYALAIFTLDMGSPLFQGLSEEQVKQLKKNILRPIRPSIDQERVGFGYRCPPGFPASPRAEWDRFSKWYESYKRDPKIEASRMTVQRFPSGKLRIEDRRGGGQREIWLEGDSARIYDLCHQGWKLPAIAKAAEMSEDAAQQIVSALLRDELVLEIEGFYLALALRPRDELITNYLLGLTPQVTAQSVNTG